MSNPLVTPQFVPPLRQMNELYNVVHGRPFSILFANYSWALGIAGALALLWAIETWRGRRESDEFRFTLPLAAALIVGGFINILSEVQQPGRLIYGYYLGWNNWDTALIKYGIILLPILLVLTWWLSFQVMPRKELGAEIASLSKPWRTLTDFFSLWSRHYSLFDRPLLTRIVLVTTIILGLFAPLYSAVFLMNEHGVPLWNSPAQAMIFLASSIAMAALIQVAVAPVLRWLATGQWQLAENRNALRWLAVIAIAVCAVIWYGWMWWLGRFGTTEQERAANLFMGPYALDVFWNWTFIGILIPTVLLLFPTGRAWWAQFIACLGVVWGSYATRLGTVLGGEAINRSGAGYYTFHFPFEEFWPTGVSVVFTLGILAALLAAMPRDTQSAPFTAANKA